MTLIAGIFNRKGRALADSVCRELAQSVSRHPGDVVETIRKPNAFFAKLDLGAFSSKGVIESDDTISLLTGEPLLERASTDRNDDLRILHGDLVDRYFDRLKDASGAFSIAHYQSQPASLTFIGDKCALRPLYFWISDEFVVFAGALRIIEACSLVPKKMDLRGVTEIVALNTTLGNRTPYVDVHRLTPGLVIEITRDQVQSRSYWRWDRIDSAGEGAAARLEAVHDAFAHAIARRMGDEQSTSAFLSGGLDSRLIVAALREHGAKVHTVNFALTGTQDQFLGNEFARQAGTIHQSIPRETGDQVPDYSSLMAGVLKNWNRDCERPSLVWSGEGGSTTLGFVRFTESIVEQLRSGQVDSVIDWFVRDEATQVPTRMFRPHVLDDAMDTVRQGVREELSRFDSADPAWNLYLYLTLSDQARKLTRHFENIDLHRLEFQAPFFDPNLLQAVLASQLDWFLRHKFYHKLLTHFGAAAARVPWQSYPGHEPCPLPIPPDLTYQWSQQHWANERSVKRQNIVARALRLLRESDFPNHLLDRRKLRVAAWIHSTGWRDYQYAIEAAHTYYSYWKKCGGNFSLSGF
jgi:asparagine synthetase B (glutamine-hydrolysing)